MNSNNRIGNNQSNSFDNIDISTLTDLRDIQIDMRASVEKKKANFITQSKNPYIHRIGDYVVRVSFQEEGPSLDDRLMECVRHMAEIYIET